jgi:hypothetical protein
MVFITNSISIDRSRPTDSNEIYFMIGTLHKMNSSTIYVTLHDFEWFKVS